MLVTGVSTRFHKQHTMPVVVGQTLTMDTWVTWPYNDVAAFHVPARSTDVAESIGASH